MTKPRITAEELRSRLDYDQETGFFTWRAIPGAKFPGKRAGSPSPIGYINLGIDGVTYLAHRLAFLWMTGSWPVGSVDHKDGHGYNNRWDNLREGDASRNAENLKRGKRGSSSGLLGVTWDAQYGKWRAAIKSDGKSYCIGKFDDKHEAHKAYLQRKREIHAFNTL